MCRNRRAHSAGLTSQNWHSRIPGFGEKTHLAHLLSSARTQRVLPLHRRRCCQRCWFAALVFHNLEKKQMNYNVKPFSGKWSESPSSPLRAGKGILFGERPALDQPAVGISQRVGNEKLWRKLEQCKEFSTTIESGIYQTGIKHLIFACFWPLDEFWTMAGGWPNRGKGQIPCLSGPRGVLV